MSGIKDSAAFRAETLRIGGEKLRTARSLDVFNPYNGERVGTVAMASLPSSRRVRFMRETPKELQKVALYPQPIACRRRIASPEEARCHRPVERS